MTTTAAPPPAWSALQAALRERRPVLVSYHGRQRILCPHALGWHKRRPMLLGYQTGGQTSTGALPADPRQRWRCLYIDEIDQIVADNTAGQWGTADNYNYSHPFPHVDEVTIAITPNDALRAS